jgi:hypothetical protein
MRSAILAECINDLLVAVKREGERKEKREGGDYVELVGYRVSLLVFSCGSREMQRPFSS